MKQEQSQWTKFLEPSYQDPFSMYKEKIAVQSEELISKITAELLASSSEYTPDMAKQMAISLVMQQMLEIQYQNSPETQKAMVVNLFCELPTTKEFRLSLYETCKKKISFLDLFKSKFLNK